MGEDLSKALGKPLGIELGGKTWMVYPLTVDDFAELESRIRQDRFDKASKCVAMLEPKDRAGFIRDVIEQQVEPSELDDVATTAGGVRFLLWRSLRRGVPELTESQTGELLAMGDIKRLVPILKAVSGIEEDGSDPTPSPQATP